jgi:hypothetical protein
MPDDVLGSLEEASKGLLYPSETDAPFKPFRWKARQDELSADEVLALARTKAGTEVEEVPVKDFFAGLADGEDAERFKKLRQALEKQLKGLRVFRVGSTKIDVYLVGKAPDGDWAGLKTISVET